MIPGAWRLQPLTRHILPEAVILLYHRIAEGIADSQKLCVSPNHFAKHLDILQDCYHPISLNELEKRLVCGLLPRRGVVVTFDDGYADNLLNAKPLLEARGIPATIFITTGFVGLDHEFWWDELEHILLSNCSLPPELRLIINGRTYQWMVEGVSKHQELYDNLYSLLKPMAYWDRERVMGQLAQWTGVMRHGRDSHRSMSPSELQVLTRGSEITVGAHTVTHPMLASQPVDVQREEIAKSKRHLEDITGKPVTSFSYPYGGPGDVDWAARRLVREAGFKIACANVTGRVGFGEDPYWLPRNLVRDWDKDTFAAKMIEFFSK